MIRKLYNVWLYAMVGIGVMAIVSTVSIGRIVSAAEMPWPFWALAVFTASLSATTSSKVGE